MLFKPDDRQKPYMRQYRQEPRNELHMGSKYLFTKTGKYRRACVIWAVCGQIMSQFEKSEPALSVIDQLFLRARSKHMSKADFVCSIPWGAK